MSHDIKSSLEQINEVSRQLLSRILVLKTASQVLPKVQDLKDTETQSVDDENEEATELMETRKILISTLFEKNSAEEISGESTLLQEMVHIDQELTKTAKLSKQVISEQVIKIKKSKRITKSYQKY